MSWLLLTRLYILLPDSQYCNIGWAITGWRAWALLGRCDTIGACPFVRPKIQLSTVHCLFLLLLMVNDNSSYLCAG